MVQTDILGYQVQNTSGDITAEKLIEILNKYFKEAPKTEEDLRKNLENPEYSLKAKSAYGKDIELKLSELYEGKLASTPSCVSLNIKKRFYYEEQEEYNIYDHVALDITCTNITDKELTDLSYKFVIIRPNGTQITQKEDEYNIHKIEQLNGKESNTITHGYQFNYEDMGGILKINTILSYKIKSTGEVKTEEQSCEFNTAEKKEPVGTIRINIQLKDVETELPFEVKEFKALMCAFEDEARTELNSGIHELNITNSSSGTVEIPVYEYGNHYIGRY